MDWEVGLDKIEKRLAINPYVLLAKFEQRLSKDHVERGNFVIAKKSDGFFLLLKSHSKLIKIKKCISQVF